jgi:hypothetical protein
MLLFVALSVVPAFADNTLMLNKTSGGPGYGVGHSVQQTTDAGYIITGTKYSYEPKLLSQMVWLIKTDANGNEVWDTTFDGSGWNEGKSVQQIDDGGYIITGSTFSFGGGGKKILSLLMLVQGVVAARAEKSWPH